ncbi:MULTISPECIES: winged helix-turn-helix domain-containing protein [Rhizobium/Agrobacterium group]|uniref:Winged helix-turn-helix domain-containing protein n=1 Tax=Agrobacterium tumefaciens TaxID=358 RepID=A0AAE6BUJ5_AGRTU|nr:MULTISPECIES: winged helix-turn-helix domain-containing protein [Rhizobium/Agrobacterium group]MCA2379788.1 winged helix-turn-helix domain-containing protein [Agrobacterium tomkonis RTP8]PZU18483.1 MAG: winged helix-turn-helix domain-containing protein [Shinella sp.]KRA64099.1 hypothetical protein ASD85_26340 [Rhizobium sp. Root651]MCA2371139.1 winged helix-turn-helix domain-containing protein [Agrobacterium tomkonis CIP 111-78]QCL92499.1 winged helix-turn-helix domain-containing protein [A
MGNSDREKDVARAPQRRARGRHEIHQTYASDAHKALDHWLAQATFVAALGDILKTPLADETPAAKLKQLGMLVYIIELIGQDKPITLTSLVEASGLARSAVGDIMDKLVEKGCLIESMGRNAWGRGKARQFRVSASIFDRIRP